MRAQCQEAQAYTEIALGRPEVVLICFILGTKQLFLCLFIGFQSAEWLRQPLGQCECLPPDQLVWDDQKFGVQSMKYECMNHFDGTEIKDFNLQGAPMHS